MRDEFSDGWYQPMLVPTNVVEATLRVGVVAEKDHGQVQIELRDPQSLVLIGMKSWPHVTIAELGLTSATALRELFTELRGYLDPDPFPDRPAG